MMGPTARAFPRPPPAPPGTRPPRRENPFCDDRREPRSLDVRTTPTYGGSRKQVPRPEQGASPRQAHVDARPANGRVQIPRLRTTRAPRVFVRAVHKRRQSRRQRRRQRSWRVPSPITACARQAFISHGRDRLRLRCPPASLSKQHAYLGEGRYRARGEHEQRIRHPTPARRKSSDGPPQGHGVRECDPGHPPRCARWSRRCC